jgi:hypothetical protein
MDAPEHHWVLVLVLVLVLASPMAALPVCPPLAQGQQGGCQQAQ